jgi:hypothetical protein
MTDFELLVAAVTRKALPPSLLGNGVDLCIDLPTFRVLVEDIRAGRVTVEPTGAVVQVYQDGVFGSVVTR